MVNGIENPAFVDFYKKEQAKINVENLVEIESSSDGGESSVSGDSAIENLEEDFGTNNDLAQYAPAGDQFVKCKVTRDQRLLQVLGFPIYKMVLDNGSSEGGALILAARKRKKAKTSSYLISTSADDLRKDSPSYVAKVRSNVMGTRFVSYDNGLNPKELRRVEQKPSYGIGESGEVRQEFCAVMYEQNVLGIKGPRKMTIVLPKNDENKNRKVFRPMSDKTSLLGHFDEGNLDEITVHHNRQPQWNQSTESYVLNFNGRVSQASVKNFQITKDDDITHTIMQFGRVKNDVFTLDYRHPLSAVQAMSIALSSFDHKIACE